MSGDKRKFDLVASVDWIVAVLSLLAGAWMVASSWPEPGIWAWVFLAGGLVGLPLAYFNPMAKVRKWIFRRMVKR